MALEAAAVLAAPPAVGAGVPASKPEGVKPDGSPPAGAAEQKPAGTILTAGADALKNADAAKAGDKAPDKYELKLSENTLLKPDVLDEIAAIARERGLSNEQAQWLVEREEKASVRYQDQVMADHVERVETWKAELSADKEFGGAKLNENAELVKRYVAKYADKEFLAELDRHGYGWYPPLVKMIARAARATAEDKLVVGGAKPAGAQRELKDILFPMSELQPKQAESE